MALHPRTRGVHEGAQPRSPRVRRPAGLLGGHRRPLRLHDHRPGRRCRRHPDRGRRAAEADAELLAERPSRRRHRGRPDEVHHRCQRARDRPRGALHGWGGRRRARGILALRHHRRGRRTRRPRHGAERPDEAVSPLLRRRLLARGRDPGAHPVDPRRRQRDDQGAAGADHRRDRRVADRLRRHADAVAGRGVHDPRDRLQPVVGRERAVPGHPRGQHRQDVVLPLVAHAVQLPRRRHARQHLPVPGRHGGRPRVQQLDRADHRHVHRRPEVLPRPDLLVRALGLDGRDEQELQVRRQPRRPRELVEQLHPVHLRGGVALVRVARWPDRDRGEPGEVRRGRRQGSAGRVRLQQERPHRVQLGRDDRQRCGCRVLPLEGRIPGSRRERLPLLQRPRLGRGLPDGRQHRQGRRDGGVRAEHQDPGHEGALEPPHQAPRARDGQQRRARALEGDQQLLPVLGRPRAQARRPRLQGRLRRGAAALRRRQAVPDLPLLHREPGRPGGLQRHRRPGQQQLLGHQLDRDLPDALEGAARLPHRRDRRGVVQEAPVLERMGALPERR